MRTRHHLVVGAVGVCLLATALVLGATNVSATEGQLGDTIAADASRQGSHQGDRDRDRDHRDRDHKDRDHRDRDKKDRDHRDRDKKDRDHRDRDKKDRDHGHHRGRKGHGGHKDHKGKCPEETTTTTTSTTTTTTTTTTSTTVPETTTTVPETTTTTEAPQVGGITTLPPAPPEAQPQVLNVAQEAPEVQASELAFTGASTGTLLAAGLGLIMIGLAFVSATSQRRRRA